MFREGDFIESREGFIFDVKGIVHPPDRVVAFVRYVPDHQGSRKRRNVNYRKIYELSERYSFIRQAVPEYLVHDPVFDEDLIEVPEQRISRHYQPLARTCEIRRDARTALEKKTMQMISRLASASSVPIEEFGVSGSVLVDLTTPESDIDIVVYGSESCHKVRSTLAGLLTEGLDFMPYGTAKVRALYESRLRETGISFPDYASNELRKDFQGYFEGTDFFVRYVKDYSEVTERYGSILYRDLGSGELEAVTSSDREAIYTPSYYPLKLARLANSEIESPREIVSFRGQFCEQALEGEKVVARGKLERLSEGDRSWSRLLLGNSRRDFMVAYPKHGSDITRT